MPFYEDQYYLKDGWAEPYWQKLNTGFVMYNVFVDFTTGKSRTALYSWDYIGNMMGNDITIHHKSQWTYDSNRGSYYLYYRNYMVLLNKNSIYRSARIYSHKESQYLS